MWDAAVLHNPYTCCAVTHAHSVCYTPPPCAGILVVRVSPLLSSEFHLYCRQGFTSDWWRNVGLLNHLANEDHPWHVACGNNPMLRDDPKKIGADLYTETVALYQSEYSSEGLTLCIIGQESLDELQLLATEKFGAVPSRPARSVLSGLDQPVWTQQVSSHCQF